MELEFRRVAVEAELRRLRDFDKKVFSAADAFPSAYWKLCEAWWLVVEGRRAGCCAFQRNIEFGDDLECGDREVRNVLYISSTGLLPAYRGQGLGRVMKAWQMAYARRGGFARVITNTRASNLVMIRLNESFGFRRIRVTEGYYAEPEEATVVMEAIL